MRWSDEKGVFYYLAISLRRLQGHCGINRGSISAAFFTINEVKLYNSHEALIAMAFQPELYLPLSL
jgi:hypothetical protein